MKLQFGMGLLKENIKRKLEYKGATTKEEKKKLLEDSFDEWNAYLLLQGVDRSKYGMLMIGFVNQFLLGNNQYPKTVILAIDALSNHKYNQKYWENKKKSCNNNNKGHNAGRQGSNDNNDDGMSRARFAQGQQGQKKVCYCCGREAFEPRLSKERDNSKRTMVFQCCNASSTRQ